MKKPSQENTFGDGVVCIRFIRYREMRQRKYAIEKKRAGWCDSYPVLHLFGRCNGVMYSGDHGRVVIRTTKMECIREYGAHTIHTIIEHALQACCFHAACVLVIGSSGICGRDCNDKNKCGLHGCWFDAASTFANAEEQTFGHIGVWFLLRLLRMQRVLNHGC